MCGRFVLATPPDQVAAFFGTQPPGALLEPSYNVAPTDDVYAVLEDGSTRHLDAFHWGLVPRWAKDPKIGSRMINARAESVAEKSAYKQALLRRRCIIPATGFYEWQKRPGHTTKQPFFIQRPDGEPYALAGLWEVWRGLDKDQEPLRSCTIITTTPNEPMSAVHDRMPVILSQPSWGTWLDRHNHDLNLLATLLVPAPPDLIIMHPVSTAVNNVRNNGRELIDEAEPQAET